MTARIYPRKVATKLHTRAGMFDGTGWAETDNATFAVTRQIHSNKDMIFGPGWRITHRQTGLVINDLYFDKRANALRAAQRFEAIPGLKVSGNKRPSKTATARGYKLIASILTEQHALVT